LTTAPAAAPGLSRRLGLFDATMIVMGGIIGSGIFMNPAVVARLVHTPALMLGAWIAGGAIALVAAFIYAELASRRPRVGGQYAYLREAYHPVVAFTYAWALLFIIQSGGMAAGAITFARYAAELTGVGVPEWAIAVVAVGALTLVNCLGVRAGGTLQNVFMLLKISAILALVVCGGLIARAALPSPAVPTDANGLGVFAAFFAALVPVLFAYGGGHTASFIAGELREPRRDLPRGLLLGVGGVIVLYLLVNIVCIRVLGPAGLAATGTPASDVMRAALGGTGARLIAIGIAISTLGFLSQSMLTAPRVYYAMAADGLFFQSVARVNARTHVPVVAIVLQGALAIVIALSGRYDQILNYVVSADWIFFTLTAGTVFALRQRDAAAGRSATDFPIPGHPYTTTAFIIVSALVVSVVIARYPQNTLIGLALLLLGVPAYFLWRRRAGTPAA
jgi:APA family basic amino acid/polyamine antiporter